MAEITTYAPPGTRRQMLAEFWFYFRSNRGTVVGLYFFVALVVVAVFASALAPHDPILQDRAALLTPPVWQTGGNPSYLLGTDAVGRDILSRLILGVRYSLFIGVVVVSISLIGGIVLGLVAGFFGGWIDTGDCRRKWVGQIGGDAGRDGPASGYRHRRHDAVRRA